MKPCLVSFGRTVLGQSGEFVVSLMFAGNMGSGTANVVKNKVIGFDCIVWLMIGFKETRLSNMVGIKQLPLSFRIHILEIQEG